MVDSTRDPEETDWDNPEECPFCGASLRDGGAGFVEHIEEKPACEERFEEWRANVDDDIAPEWSG